MRRESPAFVVTRLVGKLAIVHVFGEIDHADGPSLEDAIRDAASDPGVPIAVMFVDCERASASILRVLTRQYAQLGDRLRIVAPAQSAFGRALAASRRHTVPAQFDDVREAIYTEVRASAPGDRRFALHARIRHRPEGDDAFLPTAPLSARATPLPCERCGHDCALHGGGCCEVASCTCIRARPNPRGLSQDSVTVGRDATSF
ncbi:MAG: hypothetical protein ACREM2_06365 [Vulcanimicrobiaceae bacterium]